MELGPIDQHGVLSCKPDCPFELANACEFACTVPVLAERSIHLIGVCVPCTVLDIAMSVMRVQFGQHLVSHDAYRATFSNRTCDIFKMAESSRLYDYMVVLDKGEFGLGIYFCELEGGAHVDPSVPFYRRPDGEMAPGERSRVVQPGDKLIGIGEINVLEMNFQSIVHYIRDLPQGSIELWFKSSNRSAQILNDQREVKCRRLLSHKVQSYRQYIMDLQEKNAQLQHQLDFHRQHSNLSI